MLWVWPKKPQLCKLGRRPPWEEGGPSWNKAMTFKCKTHLHIPMPGVPGHMPVCEFLFIFQGDATSLFFFFFFFFFYAKNYQEAIRVLFLFLKSYQPSSTYSCHSTRPAISGLEMGQLEKGEWGKFPTGEAIYSLIREGNRHFFPLKTEKKKLNQTQHSHG